jgi:hypothetical protein
MRATPLRLIVAVQMVAAGSLGPAGASSREAALDINIPFAKGARIEHADASAASFWGIFQVGSVAGRSFRIFPDGSASFGLRPTMDEERVDATCDVAAKSCRLVGSDGKTIRVLANAAHSVQSEAVDIPTMEVAMAFASWVLAGQKAAEAPAKVVVKLPLACAGGHRRHLDVSALQHLLSVAGYRPGAADGLFGRATARALARYRADNRKGVKITVTRATESALGELACAELSSF